VEDRRGLSYLCAARSSNGVDGWRIDAHPTGTLSSVEITQGRSMLDSVLHSSRDTSNDHLLTLHGVYSPRPLNYEIVAQSADEVQDISNAPALRALVQVGKVVAVGH
jgi:hypothetical protein